MSEPQATVRSTGVPPPLWPASLPNPQSNTMTVSGPPRVEFADVLTGPMRSRVKARTAPQEFSFTVWFTKLQMETFEDWYRKVAHFSDGEFYARWIGGSRVVAFVEPYQYTALGDGYVLAGRLMRTRIDTTACDAFISALFTAIYRDNGVAADIYRADLTAADRYVDDFDLDLMARNEC